MTRRKITKAKKIFIYSLALVLSIGPIVGCGIFNPPEVNKDGYYESHYNCCGPIALEQALEKLGVRVDRATLSRSIQDSGQIKRQLLSFFDKQAACITWPSEIRETAKKYGFKAITIKEFKSLDYNKDVAIILVHNKLSNYHWVCFPYYDNIPKYFGDNTIIDKIYLLKRVN